MKRTATLLTGATLVMGAYLMVRSASAPAPLVTIALTGAVTNWLQTEALDNWQFIALLTDDLRKPAAQWQASTPLIDSNYTFKVAPTGPVWFCRAMFQHK